MTEEKILWNGELDGDDDTGFVLFEPGEYPFKVVNVTRKVAGSGNEMAVVALAVSHDGRESTINDNLVLIQSCTWKLKSFFRAIGLKKHGEPLRMDWKRAVGQRGRCKIEVETFKKRDDEPDKATGRSNKVKYYLDPLDGQPAAPEPQDESENDIPF